MTAGAPARAFERRATADPCAAYGQGFAAVAGTGTCVKIGGRVRVEIGASHGRTLSDWRVAPEAGSAMRSAMPEFAPAAGDLPQHRLKPARNY